ncbi:uncharacterized protein ACB058_002891 [Synchiropus picturatus]
MMMTMRLVILVLWGIHGATAVFHSLKFIRTASTGVQNVPELEVGLVDDVLFSHYDSNSSRVKPKQDWMTRFTDDDPEYLERETRRCRNDQWTSKNLMREVQQRFNQIGELPSVSLLQKTPSSPIVCDATWFYPPKAKLFWTKDGEELHKDVDIGEVLPNPDGTLHKMAELKLSDPPEACEKFSCVFQLEGKNVLFTNLDEDLSILLKCEPEDQNVPIALSVAAVVLLVAAAAVIGVVMWRRAGQSTETDSNSSQEVLNPLKPTD